MEFLENSFYVRKVGPFFFSKVAHFWLNFFFDRPTSRELTVFYERISPEYRFKCKF